MVKKVVKPSEIIAKPKAKAGITIVRGSTKDKTIETTTKKSTKAVVEKTTTKKSLTIKEPLKTKGPKTSGAKIIEAVAKEMAKEKHLYKKPITKKKLQEILIYEPPKVKKLVFTGHRNTDAQYIPEFLPRYFSHCNSIPGPYSAHYDKNKTPAKDILKLVNNNLFIDDVKVNFTTKTTYTCKTVVKNPGVCLILAIERGKIEFLHRDAYRLMEQGSCYILQSSFKKFQITGPNFLVLT